MRSGECVRARSRIRTHASARISRGNWRAHAHASASLVFASPPERRRHSAAAFARRQRRRSRLTPSPPENRPTRLSRSVLAVFSLYFLLLSSSLSTVHSLTDTLSLSPTVCFYCSRQRTAHHTLIIVIFIIVNNRTSSTAD